ncbi:hypothetical protein [Flexithrix dorotheae]|uniref:hypothetical protein n=1 Tax=Flexithrix dorotheae TaxID=70993 RepID=UPI000360352B|nr:hypothetical protein [Flexithrix dorotheae]
MQNIYLLLLFFCFTPFLGFGQHIFLYNEKVEIQSRAKAAIDEYQLLLNTITNKSILSIEAKNIIQNSYKNNNVQQLFLNKNVLVESPFHPSENIEVSRYLQDFNLFVEKKTYALFEFKNIRISEIRQSDYPYLLIFYDIEFVGKFNGEFFPETFSRVAEFRIETNEKNRLDVLMVNLRDDKFENYQASLKTHPVDSLGNFNALRSQEEDELYTGMNQDQFASHENKRKTFFGAISLAAAVGVLIFLITKTN